MTITDNDGFIRNVLDAAPALGVDEHGVWLLDLRVIGKRWHVEAVRDSAGWQILSMTPKLP